MEQIEQKRAEQKAEKIKKIEQKAQKTENWNSYKRALKNGIVTGNYP